MELIVGRELTLRYRKHEVFSNLSFSILPQKIIGLVGRNGSGKSSLIKILAGLTEYDEGEITKSHSLTLSYQPQDFVFQSEITVDEFLHTPHQNWHGDLQEWHANMEGVKNFFEIPPLRQNLNQLSGGQQRQMLLLKCLTNKSDVTLLDEPTNHMDLERLESLQTLFKTWEKTIIIISHDRFFLNQTVTDIWELDRGRLFQYSSNYKEFLHLQEERYRIEKKQHEKLEQEINREREWVNSGVKARGTKDTGRMQRFVEMEKEYASFKPKPPELRLPIPKPQPLGDKILILEDVNIADQFKSDTILIKDLNLEFIKGMRVGILGPNGSGKTTLIQTILGNFKPISGKIRIGQNTVFNYQDQKRTHLPQNESIKKIISDDENDLKFGVGKINVYAYLKKFLFDASDLTKSYSELSGGQKARVVLAYLLKSGGNFLILDEPTNDIDLDTMQALESTLLSFNGCVLLVSHDRFFLDKVCTHLLVLEGRGSWKLIHGGYSSYLQRNTGIKNIPDVRLDTPIKSTKKYLGQKLERQTRTQIREIEKKIDETTAEINELEQKLQNPDLYTTSDGKTPYLKLLDKIQLKNEVIKALETTWLELNQKLE